MSNKKITKELFLEILKEMPTGLTCKLKIGENEHACKELKLTMQEIKDHNNMADGFDEGYKKAVENYKEWRNEVAIKVVFEE